MAKTRIEKEARRMEAARDLMNGLSQADVARKFRVTTATSSRWSVTLATRGIDGLKLHKPPGRPCRLDTQQRMRLIRILQESPSAYGLSDKCWSPTGVALVIKSLFGISYGRDHARKLMRKLRLEQPASPPPLGAGKALPFKN